MAFIVYGDKMKKLILLFFLGATVNAQDYPYWFLFQDQVNCSKKIVTMITAPTFYRDSAIGFAFRMGCGLLAKYTNVKISGGQAFWTTEAGVHSMGSHYVEEYDSSLTYCFQEKLKVIDYFIDKQKLIVFSGDSLLCSLNDRSKEKISVSTVKQPPWVEELPNVTGYFYGVGSSEEYYYETSSWDRAEHNAFMSLARTAHSTVQSMQKKNMIESQDIFNEDVDVELQNVEIAARWRDVKKKVFYVLAKTKR